jgi:hypothetical protein
MPDMVCGDLSGDGTLITAGCYLGREDQWASAEVAWNVTLRDAGVQTFHATDFFNARREFDHDKWRREVPGRGMVVGGELHECFAERFVSIPIDSGLIGFAYSLDVPAFVEILAPELARAVRKHRQGHPRTQAIMSCLASIEDFFIQRTTYREKGRIDVIFENEHGDGKFVDFFDESLARRERWTYFFRSFVTRAKSFIPLQMADLLAHETWRRTKHVHSNPDAPLRKSFERMVGNGQISLRKHDRDHCVSNAVTIRDLLNRYPDGLIPPVDGRDAP